MKTIPTPGPWHQEDGVIYSIVDESEYLIADTSGDNALGIEECEANAGLIASAPELLRLLESALLALRCYQRGNASTELAQEIADTIEPVLDRYGGGLRTPKRWRALTA